MSYKNDHALTIANKWGAASSSAKAELYETYDRLRDLTVSGSTGTGSGFGSAGGFLWQLANLFAPSAYMPILGGSSSMNIPGTSYWSPNYATNSYYDSGTHLFKEMDDRNLFLTFIALVVYEKKINPPFGLGSTTPAKFCYRELLQRVVNLEFTLDFIYDVGDWAAEYSYNKEIPMGGHGGPRKYFAFWRQYEERTKKEKEDAIIRRKEKKRLKAEAHAERLRKKEIRDRELGYKK